VTKYLYDKNGNWTKEDIYSNGKLWLKTKREIEYYE
jgi:hypothetical protein